MNIIFEKNFEIVKDKFILKPRKDDILNFMDDEELARSSAMVEWTAMNDRGERSVQSWIPENVTRYVKDGKSYLFYGFQFENKPRQFFLFETTGK